MTKTYTITTNDTTITYTVRTCTAVAVSIGETERVPALYVDYYEESGEHVEYVVFNETMPEDEDEFMDLCDYSDGWDSHYMTIATVCFDEGVNIDESVNAAAERIRNASSLSECDDAVAIICESAGMLHDLIDASDETVVLLKAANLLGVDVRGQWGETHEILEDNAGEEKKMKTVTIYIVEDVTLDRSGYLINSETHCFFDEDKARRQFDSCCIRDEMERHGGRKYSIYMAAHTVRLPDDYEITTAENLDEDLSNGDVESPDYAPFQDAYLNTSNEEVKEI